jgi:formylglycine-generating enzyme required for sulfatase activity
MRRVLFFSIIIVMVLSAYLLWGCGGDDGGGGGVITSQMIYIPDGSYVMGDTIDGMSWALPTRTVNLDAYWIGQYEVTNREYASILNWAISQGYLENSSGGAYTGGDLYAEGVIILELSNSDCKIDYIGGSFTVESVAQETHPVVMVSWYGAVMYCNWLSQQKGKMKCYNTSNWECNFSANGYRLPTEAEWEKASGHDPTKGTYQQKRRYPWGDTWDCTKCNNAECGPHTTEEAGSYPTGKSYYGCYDMAGNVWEWCNDKWQDNYSGLPDPDSNPTGPAWGPGRVLRGGGCYFNVIHCRSTSRNYYYPSSTRINFGFRVARTD